MRKKITNAMHGVFSFKTLYSKQTLTYLDFESGKIKLLRVIYFHLLQRLCTFVIRESKCSFGTSIGTSYPEIAPNFQSIYQAEIFALLL